MMLVGALALAVLLAVVALAAPAEAAFERRAPVECPRRRELHSLTRLLLTEMRDDPLFNVPYRPRWLNEAIAATQYFALLSFAHSRMSVASRGADAVLIWKYPARHGLPWYRTCFRLLINLPLFAALATPYLLLILGVGYVLLVVADTFDVDLGVHGRVALVLILPAILAALGGLGELHGHRLRQGAPAAPRPYVTVELFAARRGKGVGRALLWDVARSFSPGARFVARSTDPGNHPAYLSMGFTAAPAAQGSDGSRTTVFFGTREDLLAAASRQAREDGHAHEDD
jgi:hypothetical protein